MSVSEIYTNSSIISSNTDFDPGRCQLGLTTRITIPNNLILSYDLWNISGLNGLKPNTYLFINNNISAITIILPQIGPLSNQASFGHEINIFNDSSSISNLIINSFSGSLINTLLPGNSINLRAFNTVGDSWKIILTGNITGSGITVINGTTPINASTIGTTTTISLNDTTVVPGSYTYASLTVDQKGRLTTASNGTAPITNIAASLPLSSTGGTTPTISLNDTAVVPGSYTFTSLTVDQKGRITTASNGLAATPTTLGIFYGFVNTSNQTWLGYNAGGSANIGGINMVAIGTNAGQNNNNLSNNNTFIGYQSGINNTTGSNNTLIGSTTVSTTNSDSTLIGYNTSSNANKTIVIGSTAISNNAESIALGYGATTNAVNQLAIGAASAAAGQITNIYWQGATQVTPGTASSTFFPLLWDSSGKLVQPFSNPISKIFFTFTYAGTGFALGSATRAGSISRTGFLQMSTGRITLGAGTTIGTSLTTTVGTTSVINTFTDGFYGSGEILTSGGSRYPLVLYLPPASNTATFLYYNGSPIQLTNLTGTAPVILASGDTIRWSITFMT